MTTQPSDPVYFLMVDDLEENLLALEGLLRREGLVTLRARSGTEALEYLLRYEVALALIDVQMPEMNGFELAELMRGSERTRRVPIIFLTAGSTGSADRQRRFRGYEAGAVDFLEKPLEPDILRSKADVFFELFRQRQEVDRLLNESRRHAEVLREADRHKDEFLAMLAHELRNPLAPIRNAISLMGIDEDDRETARWARGIIDRQVRHLTRLVDDLLDVGRITQGKITLAKVPLAVSTFVNTALESSRPLIDARRHRLEVGVPDAPLRVEGDPTRLAQVVLNLLNNAAKYTPEGGHIRLDVHPVGHEVQIRVRDTGVGIPPEIMPQIFELFTQIDHSIDRSEGGLGIGLTLVDRLVRMHGGAVEARSEGPGKGSEFVVRLPMLLGHEAEPAPVCPPHQGQNPVRRILLVDDNVDSVETLARVLKRLGHEVEVAHDGPSAIDLAMGATPELALLDIGLPGMDGFEIARRMRATPSLDGIRLIALTGYGSEADRRKSLDAGFHEHLVKPVDLDRLIAILEQSQIGMS